jgi:hypothetical protein
MSNLLTELKLYHTSSERFPGGKPNFDAYFGNAAFLKTFPHEFGQYTYEVVLPSTFRILDLNKDSTEVRQFKAAMARLAFPQDTDWPAQLLAGTGEEDFYEIWTDKQFVLGALKQTHYDGVKYQLEYVLPKKTVDQLKGKQLQEAFAPKKKAGPPQTFKEFTKKGDDQQPGDPKKMGVKLGGQDDTHDAAPDGPITKTGTGGPARKGLSAGIRQDQKDPEDSQVGPEQDPNSMKPGQPATSIGPKKDLEGEDVEPGEDELGLEGEIDPADYVPGTPSTEIIFNPTQADLLDRLEEAFHGPIEQQYPRIYVDMDGVVADFMHGVMETLKLPSIKAAEKLFADSKKSKNINLVWEELFQANENFWFDLPLMPNAQKFWRALNQQCRNVWFLTGLPEEWEGESSANQKAAWLHRYFGHPRRKVLTTPNQQAKTLYAVDGQGRQTFLIDDRIKTVQMFRGAGGAGFVYTDGDWQEVVAQAAAWQKAAV